MPYTCNYVALKKTCVTYTESPWDELETVANSGIYVT